MGQNVKYLYFAIGIIIGITIGAAVVWWMQNYDFKIWFTFSGKGDKYSQLTDNKNNEETILKDKFKNLKNKSNKVNNNTTYNYKGDTNKSINKTDILGNDSASSKSNLYSETENDEDIVIAKDEFLYAKNIKIENYKVNFNSKDNLLDSILINDKTKNNLSNIIKVEFWRSPINYKGYKFFNNKLVLFGIYDFENVFLEFLNNSIYLVSKNSYYLIEKNSNFQPFITSKSIKQNTLKK